MSEKRNDKTKYKDFVYSSEIRDLLDVKLTKKDEEIINAIILKAYEEMPNKVYLYLIRDLYVLFVIHNKSSKELSEIYDVGIRNIQMWLKDLDIKKKVKKTTSKKRIIIKKEDLEPVEEIDFNSFNFVDIIGKELVESDILPQSVKEYFNYLETIKGKSINTISAYKVDLTLFFRFMKIYKGEVRNPKIQFEEIDISDIDKYFIRKIKLTDIYAFLSFLEKHRNNGSYARARKVACLKSYYKFLYGKARIIDENPTIDLESPKINKRHPIYLTLDESVHLLENLDKKSPNYYRDYCILTLFLNCGLRLSELCGIKINKIKGDTLTIIGKGDKERTVYLNDASIRSINNYMAHRDDSKATDENKQYLLLSSRNLPINKRTVELLVKKHIRLSGISNEKYTPHKLRHTAATLMYKYGNVDIRSLQGILGHENISTTQIYTHIDDESLRDAVKSNPLSKIK